MVKRQNLRKLGEIRNFQKHFANYQLAPLIDNLRSFFQTAQNWSTTRVGHCVSVKHCTVR